MDEWHVIWLREGVEKWNNWRKKVKFSPNLSGQNFFELLPPDFRDAPKTSRYFERIDLSGANLENADLSGLNFQKSKFSDSNLSNSNLSMSNFNGVDFKNCNFSNVNTHNSFFERATFINTNLNDVSFRGAMINRAIFVDSNLSLKQKNFLKGKSALVFDSISSYNKYKNSKSVNINPLVIYGGVESKEIDSGEEQIDSRTRKNRYDVFFGTNRSPSYEKGYIKDFGATRDEQIYYGVCEVIIPDKHKIGSIGSPMYRRLLNRSDDRLRIDKMISLNEELFWKLLRETSGKMKVKALPTIFVHGYNNTFEDSVIRSAQIGYDLGLGQGIGLFSWPSLGKILRYHADETVSEECRYAFADFIEKFVEQTGQGGINIIAHSMGCRIALGAMEVLSLRNKGKLKSVNQLILAAADVDIGLMKHLGCHAVFNCVRTTSYASDADKALKLSRWLHNYQRVGISPPPYILNGMDTIVVNNAELISLSHNYFATCKDILSDIFQVLKSNRAPEERFGLQAILQSGSTYWRFSS